MESQACNVCSAFFPFQSIRCLHLIFFDTFTWRWIFGSLYCAWHIYSSKIATYSSSFDLYEIWEEGCWILLNDFSVCLNMVFFFQNATNISHPIHWTQFHCFWPWENYNPPPWPPEFLKVQACVYRSCQSIHLYSVVCIMLYDNSPGQGSPEGYIYLESAPNVWVVSFIAKHPCVDF